MVGRPGSSGVVDWANACLGPAAVDVAHFRVNLAVLHGPATADAVLPGDPAWDLELAMGFLEWGPGADAWPAPGPSFPPTRPAPASRRSWRAPWPPWDEPTAGVGGPAPE